MRHYTRREFVRRGLATGAALAWSAPLLRAASPNDTINLGFISCGGRAGELMGAFGKIDGVRFAGLCDPDSERLGKAQQKFPDAKSWADLRSLLDDKSIDTVVIATSNHWHCLAAIWAMQAGKDVYVEKPLSHNQWEGRQTVAAAAKYGKICQVGMQQRSDPMQAEIKRFLHDEQALGKIISARVNRYGVRASIGKRPAPLPIPAGVDYNLWLGPAQDEPIYRDNLQYDWHWVWNTGSGEMGNWGVHVLDDCRNNVFLDKVALPKRILGGGGRVVWNDAGETPNVHFVYFDTGSIPVVIGLANITAEPNSKRGPSLPARAAVTSLIAKAASWKASAAERRRSTRTANWSRSSRERAAWGTTSRTSSTPSAGAIRRSSTPASRSATIRRAGATWRTSRSEPAARTPRQMPTDSGTAPGCGTRCGWKWAACYVPTASR